MKHPFASKEFETADGSSIAESQTERIAAAETEREPVSTPRPSELPPQIGALECFRNAELRRIRKWLHPGARVLEIGAGSGFQARVLHGLGCAVTAIDVRVPQPSRRFWPVEPFDGLNLPFPESSFDLVFTSNVLEHVRDRPGLLREIERVTSLRGYAIHIVPSATWRLWTSVTRILHVAWRGRKNDKSLEDAEPLPDQMLPPRSVLDVMLGRPHGEYASAALELWWFRRSKWSQALRSSGFTQVASFGNRLFYTGYTFLPQLPLEARALASRVLGSSCHVFVLQRIDASPAGSPTVAERIGR